MTNVTMLTILMIVLKLKHSAVSAAEMPRKILAFGRLKINKEAVFIAHNGSNYDSHFILSYLVENTECPELLSNVGKLLQLYIKACESKFIDSCCFLSMSLSKFGDTFNLLDVVTRLIYPTW